MWEPEWDESFWAGDQQKDKLNYRGDSRNPPIWIICACEVLKIKMSTNVT